MKSKRSTDADFERQLSDYRRMTQAVRSRPQHSLNRVLYGAGTAALVIGSAAEAAVMYSGPQNIMVSAGAGGFDLRDVDINGDGVDDFRFSHGRTTNYFSDRSFSTTAFAAAARLSSGSAIGSVNGMTAKNYPLSATIGPALLNPNTGQVKIASRVSTSFGNGIRTSAVTGFTSTGFMGALFDVSGQTHAAWIRVDVELNARKFPSKLTILDWAWESDPDTGLHVEEPAVAIPETETIGLLGLGLLALGFTGLRRHRRRTTS